VPMNLKKSFEILEIGLDATEAEAKQAYKDLVAVWHPDRFSHNPRLRRKAEEKLKEANLAFETVKAFFAATGKGHGQHRNREQSTEGARNGRNEKAGSRVSKTELAAELGTGAVLTLWSYLSKKINHLINEDVRNK
jgi:curved DNA-binding protein CbpA